MKSKIILVILPFTLLVFGSAHAQVFYSGNDIYSKLIGSDFDKQLAYGYIAGVSDVLIDKGNGGTICTKGQRVNLGQFGDIVEKYLRDNPERRGYSAFSSVGSALQKAFPCK